MTLDRTQAPHIRPIGQLSIQQPEDRTMRNGMPLHIIGRDTEDVIRFDLVISGGAWHQALPLQALFTNRMLREGTRSLDARRIAESLDYYGAWLDLSSSVTHGFVTLYSLRKYFPQTMDIVSQMLKEPTFPESELAVVAEMNKQQNLVNSQRVDVMARRAFNRALFGSSHPLGRYAEPSDYDHITTEHLKQFYDTYYNSSNCSAYVSGHVTPDVIRCIEQHFGYAPWGSGKKEDILPAYDIQPDSRRYIFQERADALQSSLKMGELTLDQKHPDYQKLKVAVTLLGGYFGSRLMSNIREEKGYTYGIGAFIVNYPGLGVLGISTEADNEYIPAIRTEVVKEIERLQNEPVSDAELDMVRNYMTGELCRAYENVLSLSEAWIYVETGGLERGFFEQSAQAIATVTKEEILSLAQTYFRKENLIAVVAGKKM